MANYIQPEIKEVSHNGKKWVTYGKKNSFYDYLIERNRGSVTNAACINSISNLIYGKGLDSPFRQSRPQEWAAVIALLPENELKRMISDLKGLGQCAIQVTYKGNHKSIDTVTHTPVQNWAAEKVNEDGEIEAYYHSNDWSKVVSENDVTRVPVFGGKEKGSPEILFIKPYQAGLFYYAVPDWFAGAQWAELEEEIANYHINNIQNGLAPSMFVSFNNGVPKSEEEIDRIVKDVNDKASGSSNAGKIVVTFNESKENEMTVTPVQLSDASEQYQFLSEESAFKVISAHRVPSPLLMGIPTKSGFSSNADELVVSSLLLETYVVNPFRQLLIHGLKQILSFNGISIPMTFESLNPFAEEENADIEELNLSSDVSDLSDKDFLNVLENMEGELMDDEEWELVDKREYSEDNDSIEEWANRKITKLAVIKSNESAESRLDKDLFKARYQYSEKYSKGNSRNFCVQMMGRTNRGVVYRIEDITQASFRGINNEHGHNGQNYSLFKYKGGVNCGHFWTELLYRRKTKTNGEPFVDKALSSSEQVNSIPKYNPSPAGERESKIAPIDMPNNGHHPNF